MRARTTLAAALAILAIGLGSSSARAGGFAINENSARAMGMGGAFTAIADSPSAVFWNPAGLALLHGLNLELGLTYITVGASYTGQVPEQDGVEAQIDAVRGHFPIPNLHASYSLHERVAVGLGVYLPYGLTSEWESQVEVNGASMGWWGRSLIKKISLQTLYINPTVAVKLHDRIYLGLGFTAVQGAVTLERAVSLSLDPADDVDFKMSGEDFAFGATAGLLVKVLPDLLNAGVTFRSGVSFTFEGNAAFTQGGSGAAVPAGLRTRLKDGPGQADLTLPHVVSFGVAGFPIDGLSVGFALDVVTWSSYDKLEIRFSENPELNTSEPKNWNNTLTIRLGGEYNILKDNLPVRLGFIFDQSPVPSETLGPELPDGDRYEFSVGAGYKFWKMSVDLAYQFLFTGDVQSSAASLPGTYNTSAHLLGLSLGLAMDI